MNEPICTCPDAHDAQTAEGEQLAYYCPTHGEYANTHGGSNP